MAVVLVLLTSLVLSQSLASRTGESCAFQGKIYEAWEKFADEPCAGWCMCNGDYGRVGCTSLCPPSPRPKCSSGWFPATRDVPSADPTDRCKCKRVYCAPRPPPLPPKPPKYVYPECRNRKPGEWFLNESCSGKCQCRGGGISCVSLCPPMGVMCAPDQVKEPYQEEMDEEGRCTCRRERCVSKIEVWTRLH